MRSSPYPASPTNVEQIDAQLPARDRIWSEAGRLVPPVFVLLVFGALVFLLMVVVFQWASSQHPGG
jgi:hypothetical protein